MLVGMIDDAGEREEALNAKHLPHDALWYVYLHINSTGDLNAITRETTKTTYHRRVRRLVDGNGGTLSIRGVVGNGGSLSKR